MKSLFFSILLTGVLTNSHSQTIDSLGKKAGLSETYKRFSRPGDHRFEVRQADTCDLKFINQPEFVFRENSHATKLHEVLYILDGREVGTEMIEIIDPKTVESISVLKDLHSLSLYGPKARNGVVIIKTKIVKPLLNKMDNPADKN